MPIRYKVVKKKSRCSAVVNGKSSYGLKYLPRTTVFAKEGTLGIMTFETLHQAANFAQHLNFSHANSYIIIAVVGIGRGNYPMQICQSAITTDLNSFYFPDSFWSRQTNPPDGTLCYKSVKVLE